MELSGFVDLCRICLRKSDDLKCLFDLIISHNTEVPLVDFLSRVTNIEFSKSDGLPEWICTTCMESLTKFFFLIETCINSNNILKQNSATKTEVLLEQNDIEQETQNDELKFEIKEDFTTFEETSVNEEHLDDDLKENKITINKNKLECSTCSKVFTTRRKLSAHVKTHKVQSTKRVDGKSQVGNFQCDVCGKKFGYEYLLKQHSYKHSNEKPFPCPKCDKGCITKESLRRHMVIHNENYSKRKHKCEICNKEFPYPSFLAEHMKNHTGEKPFLCSICGKGFRQSGSLAYHLRSHSGTKKYKCEQCDNYFMTTGTLRVHMRIHTNERPYVCDICGMAFKQSTDMKSHRRNHLGERRVLCFICGKRLATTGQLTVHMRSHTGEKPYKCSTCSKAFSTRTMLVKHIRIHTGERPYTCNICNKSFNQRSTLKTHLNTHKQEIPKTEEGEKVMIQQFSDNNCIVIDQNVGAQYSIETVRNLDLNKTEVNVVVLPTPVPMI